MNHLCGLNMKCLPSISSDESNALKLFRDSYNACQPSTKNNTIQPATWFSTEELPACDWRPLDDLTLYRFLCADIKNGKYQPEISLDRLLQTLAFREKHGADEILRAMTTEKSFPTKQSSFSIASGSLSKCGKTVKDVQSNYSEILPALTQLLPNLKKYQRLRIRVFTGRDHDGQPVIFERLGEFLGSRNYAQFTIEEWIHFYVWDLERHFVEMREAAQATGRPISKYTYFADAHGINSGAFKAVPLIKELPKAVEKFYPETAGNIILFRVPKVAVLLFKAVKPFLDPVTAGKVTLFSGIPTATFLKYVPVEAIPEEYGGISNAHYPRTATS